MRLPHELIDEINGYYRLWIDGKLQATFYFDAGCWHVDFGTESIYKFFLKSQAVALALAGKPDKPQHTYRCTRNTPYLDSTSQGHWDLDARAGYYKVAASATDVIAMMSREFPEDTLVVCQG